MKEPNFEIFNGEKFVLVDQRKLFGQKLIKLMGLFANIFMILSIIGGWVIFYGTLQSSPILGSFIWATAAVLTISGIFTFVWRKMYYLDNDKGFLGLSRLIGDENFPMVIDNEVSCERTLFIGSDTSSLNLGIYALVAVNYNGQWVAKRKFIVKQPGKVNHISQKYFYRQTGYKNKIDLSLPATASEEDKKSLPSVKADWSVNNDPSYDSQQKPNEKKVKVRVTISNDPEIHSLASEYQAGICLVYTLESQGQKQLMHDRIFKKIPRE